MTQEYGLFLLQRQDNIEKGKSEIDALRRALLSTGREAADLFPEYFRVAQEYSGDINDPEAEYDYSDMEWEMPENMSPDDMVDLEAFLQGQVVVPTEPGWVS